MSGRLPAALPWLAGLLAVYLIAPLAAGIAAASAADWRAVDTAALARAALTSVLSASLATLVIALLGIPLGYILARRRGRAAAALGFLVQLPLALPPLSSGILLLFLIGYNSPLGRLTGGALTDSFLGIVLSEVFVAAPFLVIAARSAFVAIDPVLEEVAATLGHAPLSIFLRVSLPLAWPATVAGLLLAWLRAFGEFGATVMVAYHPYSLPVYTYVAFGAQGLPAMLPIVPPTLLIALLLLALAANLPQRPRLRRSAKTAAPPVLPASLSGRRDAVPLDLHLEKRLGEFRLHLAWSSAARRLAILGPSGSGKTLSLKLIAGIAALDGGRITLAGTELSRLPPARRGVAYVPQNYGLFPHLSVAEQLSFPVGADLALCRRWIERFRLEGLEDRAPAALSLGQQQRVAVARALVRASRLILLDEPFSALDAPLRADLRRELLSLQSELDATTILVTHDPQEAALLADELLVLADGRVLQSGPTAAVFRRPADGQVARLLGAENLAGGLAIGGGRIAIGAAVSLAVAEPAFAPGTRVGWSVPAAGVRLVAGGPYRAEVESVAPLGAGFEAGVRLGEARLRVLGSGAPPDRGGFCGLEIDPDAVQLWPME
ncbi:MAG TPA: ATP-binding cassette domain-containing protein [Stellaceae bacterium]|nr:ATP-binding cassette domain-containing protein [Stellaceae bacterium]